MMEYQPFSVAMSVYKNDNPIFFDRALDSITNKQTVKPSEIVLVVDGPVPDETNKVIDKYSAQYNLKVIRLEANGGLGNALRISTENCLNELIARMDSDDVAVEDRFEQQLTYLSLNKNVDVVGGNISEFIDREDNLVSYRIVPTSDDALKQYLKKRCPFNHMTVMFRKAALFKAGGYLDWHYNEDYYLWVRMCLHHCVFANTGTILVNVRTGLQQFARRGGWTYYKSEKKLQRFMLTNKVICFWTFANNCFKRFIFEVLLPNRLRGYVFSKFARSSNDKQSKGASY